MSARTFIVTGSLTETDSYASRARELLEPCFLGDEDLARARSCNPEAHDLRCHLPAAGQDCSGKGDTIETGSRGAGDDVEEVPPSPVNRLHDMVGGILLGIAFEKCMALGDVVPGEAICTGFNVWPDGPVRCS